MAHGTRVNGTAYGITGGKCLVGGTGYKIKKGRTLIGGTGYDITFGTPLGSIQEGQVIQIHENGVAVDYFVARHNYEAGLNGNGGTLVFRKPSAGEVVWDSGGASYSESEIDAWLNTTFLNRLSLGAINAIRATKIESAPASSWQASVIERKIFLPSLLELGDSGNHAPIEGEMIPASSLIIDNGELPGAFWTRSNSVNDSYMAYSMRRDGRVYEDPKPYTNPIRPMFVLDSNADISTL